MCDNVWFTLYTHGLFWAVGTVGGFFLKGAYDRYQAAHKKWVEANLCDHCRMERELEKRKAKKEPQKK